MKFFKCVISKKVLNTLVSETVYLPESYASVDKTINIAEGGKWNYGWKIESVSKDFMDNVLESQDLSVIPEPKPLVYRGK